MLAFLLGLKEERGSSVEKIEWGPSSSVGVKLLDEQHKQIVDMINLLVSDSNTTVYSETISELLTRLTRYAKEHFRDEEFLLEEHRYPDLDCHKEEHIEFRNNTLALCQATMKHQDSVPVELLQVMRDWWMNHILQSDMKYKLFLAERGVK